MRIVKTGTAGLNVKHLILGCSASKYLSYLGGSKNKLPTSSKIKRTCTPAFAFWSSSSRKASHIFPPAMMKYSAKMNFSAPSIASSISLNISRPQG